MSVGCVSAALALSGCGGDAPASSAAQRNVAERFAAAVFRGDAPGARALLARRDQPALVSRVRRAAAPWTAQHPTILRSRRRGDDRWAFSYAGRRTHADGRFEIERGDLVVVVEAAAVRFFAFEHVRTRFSTHQDAELLPSKR